MAFPTTSVIDTFNRANEGPPPSANWTHPWHSGITGGHKVVSNLMEPDAGDCSSYWSASTFGPDTEVYLTLPGAAVYTQIVARLTSPNTAGLTCYMVELFSGVVKVFRWDDSSTQAQLGTNINQSFTAGDSLGMSVIGTEITVWYKIGAGSWTSIGTRTDATYSGAGYIGIRNGMNGVDSIDNFGGGTEVTGPPIPDPTIRVQTFRPRIFAPGLPR